MKDAKNESLCSRVASLVCLGLEREREREREEEEEEEEEEER